MIFFFPYNAPTPPTPTNPPPVPPRKAEFRSISAPSGSVSAPFGSVWLLSAPFRLLFGSFSGPFRGVGWGRGGVGERGFCKGKEYLYFGRTDNIALRTCLKQFKRIRRVSKHSPHFGEPFLLFTRKTLRINQNIHWINSNNSSGDGGPKLQILLSLVVAQLDRYIRGSLVKQKLMGQRQKGSNDLSVNG